MPPASFRAPSQALLQFLRARSRELCLSQSLSDSAIASHKSARQFCTGARHRSAPGMVCTLSQVQKHWWPATECESRGLLRSLPCRRKARAPRGACIQDYTSPAARRYASSNHIHSGLTRNRDEKQPEEGDASCEQMTSRKATYVRANSSGMECEDAGQDCKHGSNYDGIRRHVSYGSEAYPGYRHARATKATLTVSDPRIRCTELDENGEFIVMNGEFKKTELIARYSLLTRDLRKIDSSNLPHILIRPSAILLNLLHLRVLIKHNRVLLFDMFGTQTTNLQKKFMDGLKDKLQNCPNQGYNGLPYEFRALEAVLASVTTTLENQFESIKRPIEDVLAKLEEDIDRDQLRKLLVLSKELSTFEQRAKLVSGAIEELLDNDDDLAAMYLTEKTHDLHREQDDHTEIELLLESYNKSCDDVYQSASNLVTRIRNTEEIIRAILDANRNALMLLDLKFSVGTLGLATGTFFAGLYGMNLENFIEKTDWGFGTVSGFSMAFSLLVCCYGLVKLCKVKKVSGYGIHAKETSLAHKHVTRLDETCEKRGSGQARKQRFKGARKFWNKIF